MRTMNRELREWLNSELTVENVIELSWKNQGRMSGLIRKIMKQKKIEEETKRI